MDERDEFNKWRERQGLKPIGRNYRKKPRTVFLSDEAYAGLQFVTDQYGVRWGSMRSVSGLLEKIGLFELIVLDPKEQDKE